MSHVCDEYCVALQEAKARIEKYPHPNGFTGWLRANEPDLYREFYVDTPCVVEPLWQEKAPLGEFNDVLDKWVRTYATAVEHYEAREAAAKE